MPLAVDEAVDVVWASNLRLAAIRIKDGRPGLTVLVFVSAQRPMAADDGLAESKGRPARWGGVTASVTSGTKIAILAWLGERATSQRARHRG